MLKRTFDILCSFVALCFISPLLLLVTLAIILSEGWPAFYSQARVGLGGKTFKLYKFRTMKVNIGGPPLTAAKDPRVTSIGRLLRRYKLDELPQLYNILVGEMSFVGPRPEVPRYVSLYQQEYSRILSIRPGLTDPASIFFKNESLLLKQEDPEKFYIETILPRKLQKNLEYVENRTLLGDIALIFKTLGAILGRS